MVVDLDGDGAYEFLEGSRNGGGRETDLVTYKADGSVLWICRLPLDRSKSEGIEWVVCVGRASDPKHVWVGCHNRDDVFGVSPQGTIVAHQIWGMTNVGQMTVAAVDIDGDGVSEVLYGVDSTLECRRADGKHVFSFTMEKHGEFINSVMPAPLAATRPSRAGLYISIAARGQRLDNHFWASLSATAPFITLRPCVREENIDLAPVIAIDVPGERRQVWIKPAGLLRDLPVPNTGSSPDAIFLRAFDTDGKSLDGLRFGKSPDDQGWIYLPTAGCVRIDGADRQGSTIALTYGLHLWICEMVSR